MRRRKLPYKRQRILNRSGERKNAHPSTLMKNLVLVLVVLSLQNAQAQSNPNLQAMIEAERAFVAMARDQNRREAFLFFLSDDAITNSPQGPVKGKDQIRNQPLQDDLLQ